MRTDELDLLSIATRFIAAGAHNEKRRGEERDTTTNLIKFQIFTHASRVINFSIHTTVQVQLVAFALLEA